MNKIILIAAILLCSKISFAQSLFTADAVAGSDSMKIRVRQAGYMAAQQILADSSRQAEWDFCYMIKFNPQAESWVYPLSKGVVSEGADNNSSDAAIINAVNAIFPQYSLSWNKR